MNTILPHPFPNFSPFNSKVHSITVLQKRSDKHLPEKKTPNQRPDLPDENDFVQRVSKKYLYFHESPTKNNEIPKQTISFPYSALNLCYFEKNFIDIKQKKLRKRSQLNSNQEIRSFLNTRLKTQPSKTREISPQKQIYVGSKIQQKRIHNEENLKNKIFFSVEKYQWAKNIPTSIKTTNQKKLPEVLKIKAKKAYYVGLYKGMNKQRRQSTIDVQKQEPERIDPQEEQNPFELKYRSRTEDSISLMRSIREEIRGNLKIRDKKRLCKYRKEEIFEPWEVNWEWESVHQERYFRPCSKNCI